MKKKALLICGLVVALLAASFFGYRAYASSKSSSSSVQTATVTTGSLAETLSSSGTARSGHCVKNSRAADALRLPAADSLGH